MGYGNLFTDLARYAGAGQARVFAEEAALKKARAQAELAEEFTVRGEQRKAEQEAAEREDIYQLLGPPLEAAMPPMPTGREVAPPQVSEYGPRAPVPEVEPYKIKGRPPVAAYGPLYTLLGQQATAAGKEPRARTMTEWRAIAQTPGHLEQAHAQRILNAYRTEQLDLYKGQIEALGEQPPDVSATERTTLAGAENLQQMARDIEQTFKPVSEGGKGGHAYVNPWWGGEGAASARRLFPRMKPGLEEESMREQVNRLANYIIRLESGLTQSKMEELRQFRVVPTMGTTPEKFMAAMRGSFKYAEMLENSLRGKLAEPRRVQPGPTPPRPGWLYQED